MSQIEIHPLPGERPSYNCTGVSVLKGVLDLIIKHKTSSMGEQAGPHAKLSESNSASTKEVHGKKPTSREGKIMGERRIDSANAMVAAKFLRVQVGEYKGGGGAS